jgi:GNAT superfamily N-acetyltransferase
MAKPFQVRPFSAHDVASLWRLMVALAKFESYADEFAVSEADLAAHGFGDAPRFRAFVADDGGPELLGMAVCYVIPWTFDLKPTLTLKELFVDAPARGRGVGQALFAKVVDEGVRIGASRMNWTVLPSNARAMAFYRQAGGQTDARWQSWTCPLPGSRCASA